MTASALTELPVLSRHGSPVKALAFSPDGSLVATADVDRNLKMSRVSSSEEAPLWQRHFRFWFDRFLPHMYIRAVAFSPDGRTLYLAIGDNLRALDAQTGEEIWRHRAGPTFGFLRTRPLSLAVSASGSVAAAYDDTTVEVRLPDPPRLRRTSAWKDNDAPNMIAFLDDDRIVGSDHVSLCIWDADLGTKLAKHQPGIRIHGLAAGRATIAARSLYDVTLWSESGEKLGMAALPPGLPTLAFSPMSDILAAGDAQGATLFDLRGAEIARLETAAATLALAFIPGTDDLAIAGSDGTVRRWSR